MAAPNYFMGIFGRSPFDPLQEHMGVCERAAAHIEELLTLASEGAWPEVERIQEKIVELEKTADEHKRNIRMRLPRGFFLPVARADLLDLLTRQDKIANKAKDIAGLMLGRKMAFPGAMQESVMNYARSSIAACGLAHNVVRELDELLATGFRGVEAQRVEGMIRALDESEQQNDVAQVKVRAELYKLESQLSPVDVMFLYRVIDWVGDLADHAQRVGHRLEMMLAK
ncbi:MAG: TIGR00153 family protein [Gammaproteobacteria bacterium]|nr:TIGR00153 family protein [Gammaproteobacteria bacterium]